MKTVTGKKNLLRVFLLAALLCILLGAGAQAGWKTTARGKRYYVEQQKRYLKGGWAKISGKWYFFNDEGYLHKGWLDRKGKRYCLSLVTGARISGKWFRVSGSYYYAASDGVVQKSKWIGECYVKSNYKRAKGWLKLSGKTYYMDKSTGARYLGLRTVNGEKYYFGRDGVMQSSKWLSFSGQKYYFTASGKMARNTTLTLNGVTYEFSENGIPTEEGKSDDSLGKRIAQYALQFEGNPYVYGGISLTNGADCSGFTFSVMKHFGISLPRTADEQRRGKSDWGGTVTASKAIAVKKSALKAGDLLFYGIPSGHVALYIGDGKVIHASDESTGIIISNYNYRTPSAARRYW